MIYVNENLSINPSELQFSYVKASGSGGQKVNKTNSQVQLRWNVLVSECLSESQKQLLLNKLNSKLTKEGELIVVSESARSQHMNKQDCLDKFVQLIGKSLHIDKPRKKTRPTKASKERRIKDKKIKSDVKNNRKKVNYD